MAKLLKSILIQRAGQPWMDYLYLCITLLPFIGDIDKNQFQPNNSGQDYVALQGNNVVVRNQTFPNGEAPISTLHLTTYTDGEKRWLIQADDEERGKGKGFM